LVTGLNNQSINYYLPDSGNSNQLLKNSPPGVRLDYPISEPTTITSFAAYITTVVPSPDGSVIFRLRVNNFVIRTITFGPGEGFPTPKVDAVPNIPVAAGDLLTVQVEVNNFPADAQDPFIASASVGSV
jgi:hypothetical protein